MQCQISTVLINLWSCSHAFGSRSPLLQFLPSPRIPLSELMDVTEEHARHLLALRKQATNGSAGNGGTVQAPGVPSLTESYQAELAVVYGMAENEALGEVCSILEEVSGQSTRRRDLKQANELITACRSR